MKRSELEHVLRAAGAITGVSRWVIVGSQAVLGALPAGRNVRAASRCAASSGSLACHIPAITSLTGKPSSAIAIAGSVDTNGNGLTLSGTISGAGEVIKRGSGTLTLTHVNTYQAGTDFFAGTIAVTNANALGTGTVFMQPGVTLQAGANGLTVGNDIRLAAGDIIDAVGNNRPPSISLDDGRRALQVADAAVESAKSGLAVRLT